MLYRVKITAEMVIDADSVTEATELAPAYIGTLDNQFFTVEIKTIKTMEDCPQIWLDQTPVISQVGFGTCREILNNNKFTQKNT